MAKSGQMTGVDDVVTEVLHTFTAMNCADGATVRMTCVTAVPCPFKSIGLGSGRAWR